MGLFLIPPPLGQPHSIYGGTSTCWLFLCFHNPPNSDIDYWIFNMRTWSFVCMRIHTGVGYIDSDSAQPFFHSEKLSFSCAPDRIQALDLWISSPML